MSDKSVIYSITGSRLLTEVTSMADNETLVETTTQLNEERVRHQIRALEVDLFNVTMVEEGIRRRIRHLIDLLSDITTNSTENNTL